MDGLQYDLDPNLKKRNVKMVTVELSVQSTPVGS